MANHRGEVARKTTEFIGSKPITATGFASDAAITVGLSMTNPIYGASYMAVPVGPGKLSIPLEIAARKVSPGYTKFTDGMKQKIRNSPRLNNLFGTEAGKDINLNSRDRLRDLVQKGYSMIKFKEKDFTIQEGHYTGPKDLDEVPGFLEMAGKGALVGGVAGGLVGASKNLYDQYNNRPSEDSLLGQTWGSYKTGSKYGLLGGIAAKVLLNAIHNPMNGVKFNEVDRNLRARFGMFQASGFTVGDTMERRNKMEEKFVTNDRNVTDYKINIAIQDGKFVMYLLSLTDEELKTLNKSLDYYCKKYYGMNYTSKVLGANSRENSYAVEVTFTNYQVLTDFLSEISDALMIKINLLDSKAIVENKISGNSEKSFSLPTLNKWDLLELLTRTALKVGTYKKQDPDDFFYSVLKPWVKKLSNAELALIFKDRKVKREDIGNAFLEKSLKDCGFIEALHYTIDEKRSLSVYQCLKEIS